ncbi:MULTISPECIES: hypothetical protein [unclassified Streptomyces]|uniref:hypothetical protein n=1 Tax=unclassified Streptomyces TaxID=2593676 RepID=UPI000698BA4D|nr:MULTISPECIES: hypothetical protein [unclassified Streptomyces]ODA73664.1 hypothetical protein APS67_002244 [Streptomyces sp. AVP053U2]
MIDGLIGAEPPAPDEGSPVRITDAGRKRYDTTDAETKAIAARVYAGIPSDELVAVGRGPALLTGRVSREPTAEAATPGH